MSIIGKPIKRSIEKLHDMRWRHVTDAEKAIVCDSSPPKAFFPHDFISNAIDKEMNKYRDKLSCQGWKKHLEDYAIALETSNPKHSLDLLMESNNWIVFFIKVFRQWAYSQGDKTKHHFDRCMEKKLRANLPYFEQICLARWKYRYLEQSKQHQFRCPQCLVEVKFNRCNAFDSSHLLMTIMRLHMGLNVVANPYVSHLRKVNSPEELKTCKDLTGDQFEVIRRGMVYDQLYDVPEEQKFAFNMTNMHFLLYRMMTFIEKVRCAYVSLFYGKLLLYNQDDDNDVETHIARGGREMPRRIAKEIKVIDKEIALVNNWGWVGRPNPKTVAHATQREKWTQTTRREAVSMYTDLRFQSTWQKIEYVVPSLRNENNPVPSVKSYHKAKACQEGSVSYFVGHGINQECHIVDPVFLENCTTSNNKTYFSTKFLNKVKSNPNKKIDLLYQTKQKLKKNMFECHNDIQIHSIKRIVVTE